MKQRITDINECIKNAAIKNKRDINSIKLVAVSKTKPADMVKKAVEAGLVLFGENYIQESIEKIPMLSEYNNLTWHFIGRLQTNKAKYAVKFFDLIHSVDSFKLASEINKQAKKIDKIQKILIQVNISKEETKSGVFEENLMDIMSDLSKLDNISVKGLMTMPPFFDDPDLVRPYFKTLKTLQEKIKAENILNINMDELSMGMTSDFETAIEEGATLIRIGTAIFGKRN